MCVFFLLEANLLHTNVTSNIHADRRREFDRGVAALRRKKPAHIAERVRLGGFTQESQSAQRHESRDLSQEAESLQGPRESRVQPEQAVFEAAAAARRHYRKYHGHKW